MSARIIDLNGAWPWPEKGPRPDGSWGRSDLSFYGPEEAYIAGDPSWFKITQEQAWQMFECLPPQMVRGGRRAFFVSEPYDMERDGVNVHALFDGLGNSEEDTRDVYVRECRHTRADSEKALQELAVLRQAAVAATI